jgi:hypothetical protein
MSHDQQHDEPEQPGPSDSSVIADKYARGEWMHSKGQVIPERYPTDKEIARAVEEQVSASVETYRNYGRVAWYTTFVAIYLLVLYLQVSARIRCCSQCNECQLLYDSYDLTPMSPQASSFKAGDVVATLKATLLPDDGSPYVTFSSADQVLAYLGNKFVKPVFKDPVCGDGNCEVPW